MTGGVITDLDGTLDINVVSVLSLMLRVSELVGMKGHGEHEILPFR